MTALRGAAVFDELPAPLGRVRFRLDRWWSDGPRALVCGCNPSDADGERSDPTVRSLVRLLRPLADTSWRLGGFTLLNVEVAITPSPAALRQWIEDGRRRQPRAFHEARARNLATMYDLAPAAPLVLAAWGNLVKPDYHLDRVIACLSRHDRIALHCLGTTASGAPKHPMARGRARVPDGTEPAIWRPAREVAF